MTLGWFRRSHRSQTNKGADLDMKNFTFGYKTANCGKEQFYYPPKSFLQSSTHATDNCLATPTID